MSDFPQHSAVQNFYMQPKFFIHNKTTPLADVAARLYVDMSPRHAPVQTVRTSHT